MNLFAFSLPLTLGTWRLTKEFIFLFLKAQHLKLWFSVFLFAIDFFSSWLNHWAWRNEVISTLLTDFTASCNNFVFVRLNESVKIVSFHKWFYFLFDFMSYKWNICLISNIISLRKEFLRLFLTIVDDSAFECFFSSMTLNVVQGNSSEMNFRKQIILWKLASIHHLLTLIEFGNNEKRFHLQKES